MWYSCYSTIFKFAIGIMNVLPQEQMECLVFRITIVYPGTVVVSCLSNDVANVARTRTVHPDNTASKRLILPRVNVF